jgi:aspartyl protease family protein
MHGDFFEPERGVMGWAWRQPMFWLVGGLAVCLIAGGGPLTAHADGGAAPSAPGVTILRPSASLSNTLVLHAGRNGYVFVDASVDGTLVRMAFDTGASVVALTEADAERIGLPGNLRYTVPFATANGRGFGAPVTLREVHIGKLEIDNVKAVAMPNLEVSLLGQSFLSRLQSYQMRDGALTLNW